MKNVLVLVVLAAFPSVVVCAELPRRGFHELNSKELSPAYQALVQKIGKSVGKVETRTVDDLKVAGPDGKVAGVIKKGEAISTGTGWISEPGNVLHTNHHVIAQYLNAKQFFELIFLYPDGKEVGVERVLSQDSEKDQAQLLLSSKQTEFLQITDVKSDDAMERVGTKVVTVGFPLACKTPKVIFGQILDTDSTWHYLSHTSLPGLSGSPVLEISRDGKSANVIGMNTGVESYKVQQNKILTGVDTEAILGVNRALRALLQVDNLREALAVKEVGGELKSELAEKAFGSAENLTNLGLWNYRMSMAEINVEEVNKYLQENASGIRDYARTLEKVQRWDAGQADRVQKEINGWMDRVAQVGQKSRMTIRLPREVPVLTRSEIREFSSTKEKTLAALKIYVEALLSEIAESKVTAKQEMERVERIQNVGALVKLLEPIRKSKEFETAETLNRVYFPAPGLATRLDRK